MHDTVAVQLRQSVANLTENIFCGFDLICAVVLDQRSERHAVYKFAKAYADAVHDPCAVDSHQIRLTDSAQRFEYKEVLRCGNPPDHQLSRNVIAYQINVAVDFADNRKAPKLGLRNLHIDLKKKNCYDILIFYHKIREREEEK